MDSILYNDIRVPVILDRPLYTGKSIKEVYSNLNITHVIGSSTPIVDGSSTPIVDGSSTPIVDGSSDTIVELYSILTKTLEITLTPNISKRFSHSMVAISNDIYIFGGYDGTDYLHDFYKIDTLNKSVTQITNTIIPARHWHCMVAISNDIYIFGGYDDTNFYKIDTLTNNTVTIIETEIPYRQQHSMVAINNDIYIFGGFGNTLYNDLWRMDTTICNATQINHTSFNTLSTQYAHSMVAINNDIYIYGGLGGTNELYKIDTTTCNVTTIFTQEPNVLPLLYDHSMVALSNDIYIYGGKLIENAVDTFYKIDTITCNVMTIFQNGASTNKIPALYQHSMVELNNEIYIFGGQGITQYNNLWKITGPSSSSEDP
jgi:N-acetylneuraminic acid mutarotase